MLEQPTGQGCTCMGNDEGLRKLASSAAKYKGKIQNVRERAENEWSKRKQM